MKHISEFKELLKIKALDIKKINQEIKDLQRQRNYLAGNQQNNLRSMSKDFRINHIAYCELRGKSREEIEIPKLANKLSIWDEQYISQLKSQYTFEREAINAQ
jgi:hypothetical protein